MDAAKAKGRRPKRRSAGRAGAEPPDLDRLRVRFRNRHGFTTAEFLAASPREIDLFLREELELQKERIYPAALICSVIANVNRDSERHPDPYTAAQFMPGAKSDDEEMREFVDAIQRGDTFESDPDQVEAFKRQMEATFGKCGEQGNLVVEPARETLRTNAIAGEPRRGLQ